MRSLVGIRRTLGLRDRCLGLSWPDGASPDTETLQQLFRQLEAEFGALTCRELVGCVTDTPEGYDRFRARGKYVSCEGYVSWACDHLCDILETTSWLTPIEPGRVRRRSVAPREAVALPGAPRQRGAAAAETGAAAPLSRIAG